MNDDELVFVVFCIENVAARLGMNDSDVYKLLTVDSKLLDEYILPSYDSLHTQGKEYIVDDIVQTMKQEGLLQ
jgi:hypothetical protein